MKALLYLTLLLWAVSTSQAFAKTPGEVEIGSTLREANLQGLAGPSGKLSEFRGKPLIINVWASWCGPCRLEMASLDKLNQRYGGKQFSVIGISTDDYPVAAEGFIKKSKIKFRQFIDHELLLENMLGADRIPLTLLVNAQGRVLLKIYGTQAWDDAQALDLIGKTFHLTL